jgi:hypothetical protein
MRWEAGWRYVQGVFGHRECLEGVRRGLSALEALRRAGYTHQPSERPEGGHEVLDEEGRVVAVLDGLAVWGWLWERGHVFRDEEGE